MSTPVTITTPDTLPPKKMWLVRWQAQKKSLYRGVSWGTRLKKWVVRYLDDLGQLHYVGSYADEEQAARARDDAVREADLHDPSFNFPQAGEAKVVTGKFHGHQSAPAKTSDYVGLCWRRGAWVARINNTYIGRYADETEAAKSYDVHARAVDMPVNFPGAGEVKAKKPAPGSIYRGVYWNRTKWQARIGISGKLKNIGRFELEADAARAYDAEARICRGTTAVVNFPVDGSNERQATRKRKR
jgi:hypothetical protein